MVLCYRLNKATDKNSTDWILIDYTSTAEKSCEIKETRIAELLLALVTM